MKRVYIIIFLFLIYPYTIFSTPKEKIQLFFEITSISNIFNISENIPILVKIKAKGIKDEVLSKKIKFYAYPLTRKEMLTNIDLKNLARKKEPEKIWEEKININLKENIWIETEQSVNFKLEKYGYYIIIAYLDDKKASLLLQITEILIIAKSSDEKILVWCVDTKTGKPIEKADINIFYKEKKIFQDETKSNGTCEIKLSKLKISDFDENIVIVASKLDSETFTIIGKIDTKKEEFLKSYITCNKPFYYLKDTIKFNAVFLYQKKDILKPAKQEEVGITIRDPKGQEVYSKKYKTNEFGAIHGNFKIHETQNTGLYTIIATLKAQTSNITFYVIDPKIPKFNIEILTNKKYYLFGEEVIFNIYAEYAGGLPVSYAKANFQIKRYNLQTNDTQGESVYNSEIKTDKFGMFKIRFLPEKKDFDATYRLFVNIVDQFNRSEKNFYDIYVIKNYATLSLNIPKDIFDITENIPIDIYIKNFLGEIISGSILVKISKKEFDKGGIVKSTEVLKREIETKQGEKFNLIYSPLNTGLFEVNIETKVLDTLLQTKKTFYVIKSKTVDFLLPDMQIIPEKRDILENTLRLIISTPFENSYLLLTLEGKKIYYYKILFFKNTPLFIEIPSVAIAKEKLTISLSSIYQKQFLKKQIDIIGQKENESPVEIHFDKTEYSIQDTAYFSLNSKDDKKINVFFLAVDEELYSIYKKPKPQDIFKIEEISSVNTYTSFSYTIKHPENKENIKTDNIQEDSQNYDFSILDYAKFKNYNSIFSNLIISQDKKSISGSLNLEDLKYPPLSKTKIIYIETLDENCKFSTSVYKLKINNPYQIELIFPKKVDISDSFLFYVKILNNTENKKTAILKLISQDVDIKSPKEIESVFPSYDFSKIAWILYPKKKKLQNINIQIEVIIDDKIEKYSVNIPVLKKYKQVKSKPAISISNYSDNSEIEELFLSPKKLQDIRIKFAGGIFPLIFNVIENIQDFKTLDKLIIKILGEVILENRDIQNYIDLLYSYQNLDGSFSYLCKDTSSLEISSYIANLINILKEKNYKIDEEKNIKLLNYFKKEYEKEKDINKKVEILFSIYKLGEINPNWLIELNKERDKLNILSLSKLAEILYKSSFPQEAKSILESLHKLATATENKYYFCIESENIFAEKNLETTSVFLQVLNKINIEKNIEQQKIINFLCSSFKDNIFSSYKITFNIMFALLPYVSNENISNSIKLSINNKFKKEIKIQPEDRLKIKEIAIDKKEIKDGKNIFSFEKNEKNPFFYQINFYESSKKKEQTAVLSKTYLNITKQKNISEENNKKNKKEIKELFFGELGDLIEITINLNINKEMQNVIIEDYIPPGFYLIEDNLRLLILPPEFCQTINSEERDIIYFANTLKPGVYTIKYYVLCSTPGNFYNYNTNLRKFYYPEIIYDVKDSRIVIIE